ncbi:MAG: hypothetical protein JW787_15135 [Sedimentisphaerales bacterium]|nr:hypothetical protein [Sedimentisphaerales bacterium]
MKRAKLIYIIIAALIVFICGIIWIISKDPQENIGPMPDSELVLTKLWNGEVVRVPGLLKVPQWMKKTGEYRRLLARGYVSTLTWKDFESNSYVAHVLGRMKDKAGKRFVCFSSMVKKRPDGSLENTTLLAGDNEPFECSIFDEKGNKIIFVSRGNNGGYTVSFFENDEDKFVKEWEINPELNIYSEQVRNENGNYHFTYNMRENR